MIDAQQSPGVRTAARPARPSPPALPVLEYHLVNYRRTWRATVLSSFVLPLFTLLGFGLGVGSYIDGDVGGVPYLDFLVPGLIAVTALQVAIGESTWPVLGNFEWIRTYLNQFSAPLRIADILAGHLAYVCIRVLASVCAFLLIATLFGVPRSPWTLAVLPLVVLIALAAAAPTFAFSASVPSDSYLSMFYRFVEIPMTLFAGVFFPVESLPLALRLLAYVSPLWHGVELSRAAMLGLTPAWSVPGHVLCLAAWAVVGILLAHARFRRRLIS